jgi:multidrug resistance efflux pump
MVVVPVNAVYVDANFKEGQLRKVKRGQPVTLTSDLYGSDVEYRGTVVGFPAERDRPSRSYLPKTPPATGSRWSSASRSGSGSIPGSSPNIRCGSGCR